MPVLPASAGGFAFPVAALASAVAPPVPVADRTASLDAEVAR